MSSPFRESETVTCVGCGDGVPREKTDVTERGNVCERCLKVAQLDDIRRSLMQPQRPPKLSDQPLRSDNPLSRLVDKVIDVLEDIPRSNDED
jgi:hypothetical protein